MARIWRKVVNGRYFVTLRGSVVARDLGRLERLCGPALEERTAPLTLHVAKGSTLDLAARGYLDRLLERGAVLVID